MARNSPDWPSDVARLKPLMLAHLNRLEWYSMVTFLGGLAFPLVLQNRMALMFGVVFAGWSAVNIIIAVIGKKAPPPRSIIAFARLLAVNMIANQFYIIFGMGFAFFAETPDWQGAGWAITLQGLALLVLDGRLLKQTRALIEPEGR